MHFIGGLAISFFYYRLLINAPKHLDLGTLHSIYLLVFVFALTGTTTVFWEFTEFLSDHTIGTHAQLSVDDTLKDMLMGMCGSITYLAFMIRRMQLRTE